MKKRKQKRALLIGAISLAVLLLVFLITFFVMKGAVNKVPKGKIADRIYIENVDVSGMTSKEAKKVKNQEEAAERERLLKEEEERIQAELAKYDENYMSSEDTEEKALAEDAPAESAEATESEDEAEAEEADAEDFVETEKGVFEYVSKEEEDEE